MSGAFHRYYPLTEPMQQDREKYPNGHTLAVKRVGFPDRYEGLDRAVMRLTIIHGTPEEYVLDEHNLAKNLLGSEVYLGLVSIARERTTRTREVPEASSILGEYDVEAVRFSGAVILRNPSMIEAVGAYVPGELSTGYMHLLNGNKAKDLMAMLAV